MKSLFLLIVLALSTEAQFLAQPITPPTTAGPGVVVTIQANNEPMVIAANIPEKVIGKWDISACTDSGSPAVTVPFERIKMALPGVPLMTASNAVLVLNYKVSRNWKQIAATVLGEASLALVPIGASGAFHMTVKTAGYLASGHALADYAQGRLASAAPNIGPLTADLIGTGLSIPAGGGCTTGGAFSALVHAPRPVNAVITLR